jgi:glutathione S-transferase
MKLYYFPLSTYSQKVLTALYEKGIAFTPELVQPSNPAQRVAYLAVNPLGKVPTLVLDDGQAVTESSIIIEYLEDHFGASGTRLIPTDGKDRARETRFHDRRFDLYFNESMRTIMFDGRSAAAERNAAGGFGRGEADSAAVTQAKQRLDVMYPIYDRHLSGRTWVMGDAFTMADCAAATALAYLRMVYPFEQHKHLAAYAARLVERPSFARVLEEAKPYLAKMMG